LEDCWSSLKRVLREPPSQVSRRRAKRGAERGGQRSARWLPPDKSAAVCFSVDDVHPASSAESFDAGGDLGRGSLGFVERLLERHPQLHVTLFVTPDWRPKQLVRARRRARIPLLAEHVHHVDLHRDARYRLDRHPSFVRYLNALPRTEIAPHGLHHVHRGPRFAVEFQKQDRETCRATVRRSLELFESARVRYVRGFAPPGWNLPAALIDALTDLGFSYVSSGRDIRTAIASDAVTAMSGLHGVPLLEPQRIGSGALQHIPINFQATSVIERAHEIIACHGLVSVKAHAFKHGGGHTMLDGLDPAYFDFLDRLFGELETCYGKRLWWPSLSDVAAACTAAPD
jgi:hypothetical protein